MAELLNRKYSILVFSYEGGSRVFEATFALGVMTPEHIQVYVRGEVDGEGTQLERAFTYDSSTQSVTITDPIVIPDGETAVEVVVQRTVPKETLYISFAGGADVTRTNIDGMVRYTLMALHEVLDGRWDISQDWEELSQEFHNLYETTVVVTDKITDELKGGKECQYLRKNSDEDLDFSWQYIHKLEVEDKSEEGGGSLTLTVGMNNTIQVLPTDCTQVYLNLSPSWEPDIEFIVTGYRAWTLNLETGIKIVGQPPEIVNERCSVAPNPGALAIRSMGDNTFLLIGAGVLS